MKNNLSVFFFHFFSVPFKTFDILEDQEVKFYLPSRQRQQQQQQQQ